LSKNKTTGDIEMLHTILCDRLRIKYPILLAGMAYAGDHALAAAVSRAGGLGVIGSGNLSADDLAREIEAYFRITDIPPGVNVFLKDPESPAKAELACRMGIGVLFTGIGNPAPVVRYAKDAGILVIPTVATVRHALSSLKAGADLLVAEGQEGGGHIGSVGTLPLVAQVRAAVGDRIPIIAAGGIGNGAQLAACLMMGAVGAMMGTRFLVAEECPVHDDFKDSLIAATVDATTITGSFTGFPMRCLANDFTRAFQEMEKAKPSIELLMFGKGKIADGLMTGDVRNGSCPAGQVIGQITRKEPAAVIMERVVREACAVTERIVRGGGFDGWEGGPVLAD
jgi:enoyl-[acyl-carrier protein] reductase II